ncbi:MULTISPECIES: SDR family oxidoreductase [Mycobacterium]|uniref:Short-chain dehydrogenase n=1 Tax=Mycobacterium kiyosense TaxID=2871094 RepID=A0A9P3Q6K9_9MYCO|nr:MULTISPECIES: SDR family oxidoreductase [Mycobacterium]BDB44441.1 short-chain dehydrogenase [Mycobacterium kiyosense]BDE15957.1 short-chain dehydrogenase [Mycobacterium sp. 20KCMC460]GLB81791.1 short-chain dehydrogenase [Mycobacterium kiyosense]GLB90345.1 short-chain dehydrogenase [Mycobacterium kiyosense]GLB96066.1 short-chain dehydrogenase [Mycobacterium kiyosense]
MTASVSGKVAFVTGGASGIGAALSAELVKGGAEVWIADRQIEAARDLARRLDRAGAKAHAIELDVRDYPPFEGAVGEVVQRCGRIDYLFNNAGIGVGGEIDSYTLQDWNDVFDVNLRGVVHGIQAVYPLMIRQGSGHIVNTASMAGLLPAPGSASYTASKHAVVAISKVLRLEAARHGVRVSVLCPGAVRTPILTMGKYGRFAGVSDEQILKYWEPMRPMAPEEFAARALRAVLRGDGVIIVPSWWKAAWYVDRWSQTVSRQFGRLALKRLRALTPAGDG